MQKLGNAMYDGILDIDETIQEMIYRSIEEGGQMLDSAITFLKKELVNVKISSTAKSMGHFLLLSSANLKGT